MSFVRTCQINVPFMGLFVFENLMVARSLGSVDLTRKGFALVDEC